MSNIILNAYNIAKSNLSSDHSAINKIIGSIWQIKQKIKHIQANKLNEQHLIVLLNQLESNPREVNLQTINDLKNIVVAYPKYHWIIISNLGKFVQNYPLHVSPIHNRSEIIQAVMNVIITRDIKNDPENEQLDLSFTDLRNMNLENANLQRTNFYQANLSGANLTGANLEGGIFSAANLSNSNLNFANLSGAILGAANLNGANLSGANLSQASLYLASLYGTILNDANIV